MMDTNLHPSWLELDRLVAGPAPHPDEAIGRHVAACARCTQRLARARQQDADFLAWYPDEGQLLGRPRHRPRRAGGRRLVLGLLSAAVLVVAGVIALVLLRFQAPPSPPAATDRLKGSSLMEMVVQRGETTFPFSGEPLRAGDILAFRYTTPRHFLLMATLERRGRVQVFYPPSGDRSARIRPGSQIRLERGLQLDDYTGPERILGLFTDRPLEAARVRRALLAGLHRVSGEAREMLELGRLPLEGDHVTWLIRKERP
jgi:hypothetical protein